MIIGPRLPETVHIVGVGGSATSGLARILQSRGVRVSGSDLTRESVGALHAAGITVEVGHRTENVRERVEMVVHSAAIPESNPELVESRRRGVEVLKYAQFLGRLVDQSFGIAVAGTHGKTSTAAMLASVWISAGREPSVLLGGRHPDLGGNWRAGRGPDFLVEACEFDRSFHSLHPQAGIITNLELDHPDIYADLGAVQESFGAFIAGFRPPGIIALGIDSEGARTLSRPPEVRIETFGFRPDAQWRATMREGGSAPVFEVYRRGRSWGRFRLRVAGRHNVLNALGVIALADALGVEREAIASGLERFPGVERRFEHRGRAGGIDWVDDFAHHPTELRTAIATAREVFGGRRLWVLFQPHQHTRMRSFGAQFAEELARADAIGLLPVYSVREPEGRGSPDLLESLVREVRRRGAPVERFSSFDDAARGLPDVLLPDDVCLACGAGDLFLLTRRLIEDLRR